MSARQTVPPLGVTAPRWDDECCPVVEPSTSTARAAAVALLSEIDWSIILDPSYGNDHFDMDPLVAAGLHAELARIDWERQTRLRFPNRTASHLLAWVTARMRRHTWCVEHIDHCDDIVPFDECWAEPDDNESDDGDGAIQQAGEPSGGAARAEIRRLEEALAVERARVDQLLGRLVPEVRRG